MSASGVTLTTIGSRGMRTVGEAPATLSPRCPLPSRKQQVLCGLAEGKTAKQIACELGIAAGTVREHTAVLRRRLNVVNQAQLVLAAYERGWFIREGGRPLWRLATVNGKRVPDKPPAELEAHPVKRDWHELKDLLNDAVEPIIDEMWERIVGQPSDMDGLAINTGIEKVICESARISAEHLVEKLNARGYAHVKLADWGLMAPDWWAEECAAEGWTPGGDA